MTQGRKNTVNQPSRSNQEYVTVDGVRKRNLAYKGSSSALSGNSSATNTNVMSDFAPSSGSTIRGGVNSQSFTMSETEAQHLADTYITFDRDDDTFNDFVHEEAQRIYESDDAGEFGDMEECEQYVEDQLYDVSSHAGDVIRDMAEDPHSFLDREGADDKDGEFGGYVTEVYSRLMQY